MDNCIERLCQMVPAKSIRMTLAAPGKGHTCPKDLGHLDLRMTIYDLRIKSKRLTPMLE